MAASKEVFISSFGKKKKKKKKEIARQWWRMPLIPAVPRRISEFEISLVYRVSSRTARAIQRNPVSKKQRQKPKHKKRHTS